MSNEPSIVSPAQHPESVELPLNDQEYKMLVNAAVIQKQSIPEHEENHPFSGMYSCQDTVSNKLWNFVKHRSRLCTCAEEHRICYCEFEYVLSAKKARGEQVMSIELELTRDEYSMLANGTFLQKRIAPSIRPAAWTEEKWMAFANPRDSVAQKVWDFSNDLRQLCNCGYWLEQKEGGGCSCVFKYSILVEKKPQKGSILE